ncbi:hypothetical protein HZU73_09894 [Apis mellifera caucasica]|uniref:Uncharacterized protein LOC113219240 n=1 Tax=Apis mellifera TaxID=7460 RepID=A0A7M7MUA7_APIME|nr:uncharacterized protein LOC113219240 [Apis mellifera]KAG6794330.1 hypothetical protein HZU73_09894 [Apis mellifera caucasica]KAG9429189.1 hypothetical protein HZU67_08518 [Apis mellifera carnica]|eukprot:XP_026300971.1 uncharacterized protein LOC113219240 [Apis mellifera]
MIYDNNVACNISKEQDYLNKKNIFDIFHFLLSHVIVQQPTNPIQYLYELLDDFILFRSGLKNPRLLWTKRHVDAIFGNVLSRDSELLPLDDYKIAMKTLSVHYDPCPVQVVPGYIDRQTFCTEALNNMKKELMRIANETI